MHTVLAFRPHDVLMVSRQSGIGIDTVFEALIERIPAPSGKADAPLAALVFDSKYDNYRGSSRTCAFREGRIAPGNEDPVHEGRKPATKC